jgi:hypothetical protein
MQSRIVADRLGSEVVVRLVVLEVALDPLVPVGGEVRHDLLPAHVEPLDAHQLWPKAIDVETGEGLQFGPFDVDRQQVDPGHAIALEELREGGRRDSDLGVLDLAARKGLPRRD